EQYPDFKYDWISPSSYNLDYPQAGNSEWMSDWKCLLEQQPLDFHDRFVASLLDNVEPDLMFCWNYDGSLDTACSAAGIPLLFNELGMLRAPNPMAYYSDSRGVNARSGFSAEFLEYQQKSGGVPSVTALA